MNYYLNNYSLNLYQKALLPITSVYAWRHLQAMYQTSHWQGRCIHLLTACVHAIPLIGAITSVIERFLATQQKKRSNFVQLPNSEENICPVLSEKGSFSRMQEATRQILTTPGFVSPAGAWKHPEYDCTAEEMQGTVALRKVVSKTTKILLKVLDPTALKSERNSNFEQYLILKIKHLSHAFSLEGTVNLPSGKKIGMEGFCEDFTIPMVASSFSQYKSLDVNFNQIIDQAWVTKHLNQCMTSDSVTDEWIAATVKKIRDSSFTDPIVIASGYNWHATYVVFWNGYLFYCNRGADRIGSGINIYKIVDRKQVTVSLLSTLVRRQHYFRSTYLSEKSLVNSWLTLSLKCQIGMPPQEVGNCTYANAEGALFTLLAISFLLHPSNNQTISTINWSEIFGKVEKYYKNWLNFDRYVVAKDILEDLQELVAQPELMKDFRSNLIDLYGNLVEKLNQKIKASEEHFRVSKLVYGIISSLSGVYLLLKHQTRI